MCRVVTYSWMCMMPMSPTYWSHSTCPILKYWLRASEAVYR